MSDIYINTFFVFVFLRLTTVQPFSTWVCTEAPLFLLIRTSPDPFWSLLSNALLGFDVSNACFGSVVEKSCATFPMIRSLNLMKDASCSGFVKKSRTIYAVGKRCIVISPASTRSFIKKYRTAMFFVRFLMDALLLISNSIALVLSCFILCSHE